MHCDLKPENILIKGQETTSVRVVDLGSACYDTAMGFMYIQSRFYRAPEVIMGSPFGRPIDLWSYACILCELATGYPVFPGEDEADQLFSIMEYLGPPPAEIVAKCRFRNKYFNIDNTPKSIRNPRGDIRVPGSKSLADFLALPEDSLFVSFVKQFFVWDPNERVTPREAMQHPWIVEEFVFTKSKTNEDSMTKKDEADDDPFKQTATAGNGVVRTRPARTAAPIPQSVMSDTSSATMSPGVKPGNLVISSDISQMAAPATNGTKSSPAASTAPSTAAAPPPPRRSNQPPPLSQQPVATANDPSPQPHAPSQAHTGARPAAATANSPSVNRTSASATSQPLANGRNETTTTPTRQIAKSDPPATTTTAKVRQVTRLFPTAGLKKPVPPQKPPTERVERAVPGLAPSQPGRGSSSAGNGETSTSTRTNGNAPTTTTARGLPSGQSVQDRVKTFNNNHTDEDSYTKGRTDLNSRTTTTTTTNTRHSELDEIPPVESGSKETVYCPTTRRRVPAPGQKGKLSEVKMVPDANPTQLPSIDK